MHRKLKISLVKDIQKIKIIFGERYTAKTKKL